MKQQFVGPSLPDSSQSDQRKQEQAPPSWLPEHVQGELAPPPTTGSSTLASPPKKGGLLSSGRYTNHGETYIQPQQLPQTGQNLSAGSGAPFYPQQPVRGKGPMTGPLFPQSPAQPSFYAGQGQAGMWRDIPVSPHESGITVSPSVYEQMPTQQAPVMPPYNRGAHPANAPVHNLWQAMPPMQQAQMMPPQQAIQLMPPMQQMPSMAAGFRNGPPPMMAQQMGFAAAPPLPPIQTKRKKKKFPVWARVLVAVFVVMLVITGSGIGYYEINFASHINNIVGQQDVTIGKAGKDGSAQTSNTTASIGTNRINILLLGSDTDGKNAAPLAQTDIVVTIDPQTKYVGMLSIPRDLWLPVPGFNSQKLDEAFASGWQYQNPNAPNATPTENAAAFSIATIENDFGIHINYWAWVGLAGFIKVIDTAGGIDLNALHPMLDDVYPNDISSADAYAYKRLYVVPGPQHMDGIQALEYVRTRHSDLVGDFGRSVRQQQVLSQLKTKLDTPGIVNELPALAKDMDGYVQTDMQLSDLVNLITYARGLDPNKIAHLVLSAPYSTSYTAPNGEAAFQPVCSQIAPAIASMFDISQNAACNVTASNNSSHNPGLASAASSGTQALALVSNANSDPLQSLEPTQSVNALSLADGSGDTLGIHNILDLMFMVTFESLDAAKV